MTRVAKKMRRVSLARASPMHTRRPKPKGTNCSLLTRRTPPSHFSRNLVKVQLLLKDKLEPFWPEFVRFFPDIWVLDENKNDLCILFEGLWKRPNSGLIVGRPKCREPA